ncbi:MAG: nitroreductase family protein [Bacteroides sp.]|nr:nitroreductase family protein [Bacteroides sp.]MCM1413832.1 nitroreductase family protein [Bacteroides sp.]MCM1471224.1 nitroreductase family protein [Bacteroides sp.]
MKTSNVIIVILAIALTAVSYLYIRSGHAGDAAEATDTTAVEATNAAYDAIMNRTSVRAYADKAVGEAQIDSLLRAAMAAPTAVNRQPWHFVVIDGRAQLDSIASDFRNISMAAEAPLAIAVCGDLSLALDGEAQAYWIQDCSAATENMLIAAQAMGLGAVWCGIYPSTERVDKARRMLDLPDNLVPLNIVVIGYPKAPQQPKDKYTPEKITKL